MRLNNSLDNISLRSTATEATSSNRSTTSVTNTSSNCNTLLNYSTEEKYTNVPITGSPQWNTAIDSSIRLKDPITNKTSLVSEYTNGDTIEGELMISLPPRKEFINGVKLAAALITFDGKCVVDDFVDLPCIQTRRFSKHSITFLRMRNHDDSYIFNEEDAIDHHDCKFHKDTDGTYIGLPNDGVLRTKTQYKVPFKFKIPYMLHEGASSLKTHYSSLPPTFGINKKFGMKITDWKGDYPDEINRNISPVLGYSRIHSNNTCLLIVNDLSPKYPSISYAVNVELIGYNLFKESAPLEVLKSFNQDVRIIPTGFFYCLAEEMAQDLILKTLKEDAMPQVNDHECRVRHEKQQYCKRYSILDNTILSLEREKAISNFKIMQKKRASISSSNSQLQSIFKGSLNMTSEIPRQGFQYVAPNLIKKFRDREKQKGCTEPPPNYKLIMGDAMELIPSDSKELSDIEIQLNFRPNDHMNGDNDIDIIRSYSSNDCYSSKSRESPSIQNSQIDMSPPVLKRLKLSFNSFTVYNHTVNPILFSTDMINNGKLDESEISNIKKLKDLKWLKHSILLINTKIPTKEKLKKGGFLSTLLPKQSESTSTDPILVDHLPWTQCPDKSWSKDLYLKIKMSELMLNKHICLVPSFQSLMISRLYELVVELEFEDCYALSCKCSSKSKQLIQLKIPVRVRNIE